MMVALTDGQATPAYGAMWRLVAAGKDVVPPLAERLKQPLPVPIDDARLKKLLADLDSSDFHVRDRVTLELECLGREAEKALRALLADGPPLEVRVRVEQILKRIADRGGKLPHEPGAESAGRADDENGGRSHWGVSLARSRAKQIRSITVATDNMPPSTSVVLAM